MKSTFGKISSSRLAQAILTLGFLLPLRSASAQVQVFSNGYAVPESISLAPAGFGSYGGQYFIPDGSTQQINVVPAAGGAPTPFGSAPLNPIGGLFLPSGWGANSGNYLVSSLDAFGGTNSGNLSIFSANGSSSTFFSLASSNLASPVIAPAGFGSYGNQLVVADENGPIRVFDTNGAGSVLANLASHPFGLAFAPAGFGTASGELLVSDTETGHITAIDATGSATLFDTVALKSGQQGLRQMAFAPSGFFPGIDMPLLFVSVTGSSQGGGTGGDVLALDSNGDIVASLRNDLNLANFDPRGLLFLDSQHLLISDAASGSGKVLLFSPSAFQAVPEPGALALVGGIAVFGAGLLARRRKTARRTG